MGPFELVDIEGERIIGPATLNGAIYLKNVPTLSLQSLVDGHTCSGTAFESSEDCDGNQVVDGIPREQNRRLGPRKSDEALKAANTGM
jgi:hypothetical protein